MDENSNRVGHGLISLGVKKGDKVCAFLRNSIEHIYAFYGTAKIGAVFVPINIQIQQDQIAHVINNSDAELLIMEGDALGQITAIRNKIPRVKTLVVCGEANPAAGIVPFAQLPGASPQALGIQVNSFDLAALLYTSGTTGPAKGAMVSHQYYIAGGELYCKLLNLTASDVCRAALPLYHTVGQIHGILSPLLVGAKVVLTEKFSVSRYWGDVRRDRITCDVLTGTQATFLYQAPAKPDDARSGMRMIMIFPVPADIAVAFEKRFNLKILNAYGLTEALLPLGAPTEGLNKVGSLGKATDYEVRIADDSDNEVPDLDVGNILVRPTSVSRLVFDGYYKMPEATAEVLKHCWFHTGDMGYRDADGFIWFSGRKKDVIRFRGENVSPHQAESAISSHPKVAECAVIGVPSGVGEEEDVKALVRIKDGETLNPEELMRFCEEKMTWFMIPRYVEFVTSLPRTATDKIEKFKLKENWKSAQTWDREAAGYKLKRKILGSKEN